MARIDPLLVAAGAVVGATLRYAVGVAVAGPPGTLAVNVAGSLCLGVVVAAAARPRVQVLVGTGLLSSFTTYSTFAVEATALGAVAGAGYVAATYLLGVTAAVVGLAAGRRLGEGRAAP